MIPPFTFNMSNRKQFIQFVLGQEGSSWSTERDRRETGQEKVAQSDQGTVLGQAAVGPLSTFFFFGAERKREISAVTISDKAHKVYKDAWISV